MHWDIVQLQLVADKRFFVRFSDGISGYLAFEESYFKNVFLPLKNPEVFNQAYLNNGVLTWLNGAIDLAPDAMYSVIKMHGEWVLR